jgi:hypothetical protein
MFWGKSRISRKVSGKVSIADAEIVVSAGRGLKSAENWGMIDLASHLVLQPLALSPFQTWDGDRMENMLVKQENR